MKCRIRAGLTASLLGTFLLLSAGSAVAADKTHSKAAKAPLSEAGVRPVQSLSPANIEDLRALMAAHALTELRTTYNGSYGASLLFQTDKPTYYIALFKDKDFWRVIKTDVFADADSVYRAFATQSDQLAQVEIDTIRLDAERKFTANLLTQNQERLKNLRDAQTRQEQEAAQVVAVQEQRRQQAATLNNDLRQTNGQLDSVQGSIRLLERMQANPQLNLPVSGTSTGTPSTNP